MSTSTNVSFTDKDTEKREREDKGSGAEYSDTRFLVPTSNMVERLFCKAGYALNERRSGLLPNNPESQFFLHINNDLWSAADVD